MKQSPIEEIITLANRGKTASIAQVVAAQEQLATLKAERDEAIKLLAECAIPYEAIRLDTGSKKWISPKVWIEIEKTTNKVREFLIKVQS